MEEGKSINRSRSSRIYAQYGDSEGTASYVKDTTLQPFAYYSRNGTGWGFYVQSETEGAVNIIPKQNK